MVSKINWIVHLLFYPVIPRLVDCLVNHLQPISTRKQWVCHPLVLHLFKSPWYLLHFLSSASCMCSSHGNCFLRSTLICQLDDNSDWDPATFWFGFEPAFTKWMALLSGVSLLLCKASVIMSTIASNILSWRHQKCPSVRAIQHPLKLCCNDPFPGHNGHFGESIFPHEWRFVKLGKSSDPGI